MTTAEVTASLSSGSVWTKEDEAVELQKLRVRWGKKVEGQKRERQHVVRSNLFFSRAVATATTRLDDGTTLTHVPFFLGPDFGYTTELVFMKRPGPGWTSAAMVSEIFSAHGLVSVSWAVLEAVDALPPELTESIWYCRSAWEAEKWGFGVKLNQMAEMGDWGYSKDGMLSFPSFWYHVGARRALG